MGVSKVAPSEGDLVDSALAEQMADEARQRAEVKRWMKRFERLIKDMPEGLEVYVGDSIAVLARGPNDEHFMTEFGGSDQAAIVDSFNSNRWDGGGW